MSHGSARQHFHDAVNLDRQADVVRRRPADNFVFGLLAVKIPDPRPIADGDHVARFDKVLRIVDLPPVLQKMAVPDALPVLRPSPCKAGATLVIHDGDSPKKALAIAAVANCPFPDIRIGMNCQVSDSLSDRVQSVGLDNLVALAGG